MAFLKVVVSSMEDTMRFLEKIGYDTSQPIHKQFGERIKEKYGVELEFDDIPYTDKEVL